MTFEGPVFVIVSKAVSLCPTGMPGKVMAEGLASKGAAPTPSPEIFITSGELGPVFASEIWPFTAPAKRGANFTLNVVLSPAAKVNGRFSPLVVKAALLMVWDFSVTEVEPALDTVTDTVGDLPSKTLPKAELAGLKANCSAAARLSPKGRTVRVTIAMATQIRPWRYWGRVRMAFPVSTREPLWGISQKGMRWSFVPQTLDVTRAWARVYIL